MILVVMAAGLGSRFGGSKQTFPIDDDGLFLVDYSIYDAISIGFDEVVFVVSKTNKELIKQTIGKRIEQKIKVHYVEQQFDEYIPKYVELKNRLKPLGTGHAILCCKDIIKSNFAVINADDFYGRNSFKQIFDFLNSNKNNSNFALVAFLLDNTISIYGSVKRGIICEKSGFLKSINECEVSCLDKKIIVKPLDGGEFHIKNKAFASMNMFGFSPKIFEFLEVEFKKFLESANLEKDEFFLPSFLGNKIADNLCRVKILKTDEKWLGLTYREDIKICQQKIKKLKEQGKYPKYLWD